MPGLSLQGTVTTEVQLETGVRTKLTKELREYGKLVTQIKALEAKKDALKAKVADLREETGLDTFEVEGFTVTLVAPSRKVLDEKKLIALGCKVEWLKKATQDVPSKPYVLITPPKVT